MTLNTENRYIIIFLLLMFGLMGQKVSAASIKVITQDQPAETCYKGSVEDVVDLVDKAIALMNKKGIFPAFRQIMDPAGGFIKGELYVFVINQKGTIVANGAAPGSVGNNTLLSRDQNGRYFIRKYCNRRLPMVKVGQSTTGLVPAPGKWLRKWFISNVQAHS